MCSMTSMYLDICLVNGKLWNSMRDTPIHPIQPNAVRGWRQQWYNDPIFQPAAPEATESGNQQPSGRKDIICLQKMANNYRWQRNSLQQQDGGVFLIYARMKYYFKSHKRDSSIFPFVLGRIPPFFGCHC